MSQQTQFQVVGSHKMSCNGCERSVEFTLGQLPGVQKVKADHKTQLIVVDSAAALDEAQVKSELDAIGYEVQPA